MAGTKGKPEVGPQELDLEHELAAGDAQAEKAPAGLEAAKGEEKNPPEGELETLQRERDALLDRLARQQADFENARKRAARDQQEFREYALTDAIKSLLPILDSFDRALQAANPQAAEFRAGVELIYKQLHDAMSKLGVRPIPAQGERFDPYLHEAIEMVETSEAQDQHVLEELQRGYRLKDPLLRPAMVRVARNSGK
jgi:molecular chaperone GrpE